MPTDRQLSKSNRRLRAPTETVRQRNLKLSADKRDQRPSAASAFWRGFRAPLRYVGRQLARLERFRVVRWTGLVLVPPYFRNSWRELRGVTWPNRRETWQLTWAVIIFSVIFGVLVAVVDYGLDKLFKQFILK